MGILTLARGLRAFGDGLVSITLPSYLLALGFTPLQIGAIATATLVGSSALTLTVGGIARHINERTLLIAAAILMAATGIGFFALQGLWPLLIVAFIGTINPTAGDTSVFLPIEQARLAHNVPSRHRTRVFSYYTFIGLLAGAVGALVAHLPAEMGRGAGLDTNAMLAAPFLVYALLGAGILVLYTFLPKVHGEAKVTVRAPLRESRGVIYVLAALFSLDAFAGGFVVQSLLALWLFQRFALDVATTGSIFFAIGILSAFSLFAAPWLVARVGHVNAMVFTHLPANVLLVLVPFMPTLELAIALLILRSALSQFDVPARIAYVLSVTPPAEHAAAVSFTAVPRGLAGAASPALAGALLTLSSFGWPLVIGGALKVAYDVLLLARFSRVAPLQDPPAVTAELLAGSVSEDLPIGQ